MSARHVSQRRQARAQERFVYHLQLLELELRMGSPRRSLEVLVELLGLYAEQLGPITEATKDLPRQLADIKRRIARPNLRLVQ